MYINLNIRPSTLILSYCIHGIHGPAVPCALLVGMSSKTFKRLQGDAPTVKVCRLGSSKVLNRD